MIRLTNKQRELLDFIREYTSDRGRAPSVTDMMRATNMPRSLVTRRLDALEAKRRISRTKGEYRSVRVIC